MLDFDTPFCYCRADENMVQRLAVLIENVRVSLDKWDVGQFIRLEQDAIKGGKHGAGLGVLVEVASEEDRSTRVQVENAFHKGLGT